MASSSGVSATSPLGPTGSNSTMVLTSTTPGTGSVLSLPVGKRYSITVLACLCVRVDLIDSDPVQLSHNLERSSWLQVELHDLYSIYSTMC